MTSKVANNNPNLKFCSIKMSHRATYTNDFEKSSEAIIGLR